jgi:hypothetical protein
LLPSPGSIGFVESVNFAGSVPVPLLSFGERKTTSGSWGIFLRLSLLLIRWLYRILPLLLPRFTFFSSGGHEIGQINVFGLQVIELILYRIER